VRDKVDMIQLIPQATCGIVRDKLVAVFLWPFGIVRDKVASRPAVIM